MDELDVWVIQSLIQSKGCASGTLYEEGKDPNLLLQLLLAVSHDFHAGTFVETSKDNQIDETKIFMIDGGAPEFFVLTGFADPVIWYSKTFIGKYLKLRELIMREKGFETAGIANLFEILGSFYLSLGNELFARSCLLQSLIEMPSYTKDVDYYDSVNQVAHLFYFTDQPSEESETAMVALYFGLAHEIGHVNGPTTLIADGQAKHPLSLERERIRDALLKAGRDIFEATDPGMADYFFDIWSKKLEREYDDPKSILNIDSLRSEIEADWIGLQILSRFMGFAYRRKARTFNKKVFVSEVITGLFIIQLIEQCRHLAKNNLLRASDLSDPEKKQKLSSLYFPSENIEDEVLRSRLGTHDILLDFAAVHRARVEFLRPTLTTFVLLHLFPSTFTIQGGALVPTVQDSELTRRTSVASENLESYLGFYFDSFMRLLGRFEDVSLFAAHLFTDSPSSLAHLNPEGAATFADAIFRNFLIHLTRLDAQGEPGERRKREILSQLTEYVRILKRRGIEDNGILQAYQQLSKTMDHN